MRGSLPAFGAAFAVVLSACGGAGSASGAKQDNDGRGPITLATIKTVADTTSHLLDGWNRQHPREPVTIVPLPDSADDQRQKMVQNAQTKSSALDVIAIDAVWTAEFAANRWVDPLPEQRLDLPAFLPPAAATGKYRGRLYAMPFLTGTGLLYSRSDLLKKAGAGPPPTTWGELRATCAKVLRLPEAKGMSCYGGQFDKYEGLTVNFSEAVHSAGGQIVDASGRPALNTPQARAGLAFLADGFRTGMIPKQAITFKEEEARAAFQSGKLVFCRNWAYMYDTANKTDGSSKVAGRFAVTPIPGANGPGAGTLGGNNLAVSAYSRHKETARNFIAYLTSAEQERRFAMENTTPLARTALYDDPALVQKYAYLPALKKGILAARPRPNVVRYGDLTAAVQQAVYPALTGQKPVNRALSELQSGLAGRLG